MNKGGYSSNCKIVPAEFCIWWQNINYYFGHLWNRTTTKIFDIFRIFTLKQQNFSQSDPVLNANFQKNCSPIQSWSGQNWLQSWSNPIQSWSVLISDIYHIYLIWLVVLKRPGFQSQKYRMPTRGGTESGCRSRLRQDSAFFFGTRIRTWSQKFVKNRTRTGVTLSFRQYQESVRSFLR